jgi:hypothetical protein
LTFTPRLGARTTQKALAASLVVQHLRETYNRDDSGALIPHRSMAAGFLGRFR